MEFATYEAHDWLASRLFFTNVAGIEKFIISEYNLIVQLENRLQEVL